MYRATTKEGYSFLVRFVESLSGGYYKDMEGWPVSMEGVVWIESV